MKSLISELSDFKTYSSIKDLWSQDYNIYDKNIAYSTKNSYIHGIEGDYGNANISVLKRLSMLHAQNNIINLKVV